MSEWSTTLMLSSDVWEMDSPSQWIIQSTVT